jgi:hypothetical protein
MCLSCLNGCKNRTILPSLAGFVPDSAFQFPKRRISQPRIPFPILDTYFFGKLLLMSLMFSCLDIGAYISLELGVFMVSCQLSMFCELRESCIIVKSKANIAERPVLVWHT